MKRMVPLAFVCLLLAAGSPALARQAADGETETEQTSREQAVVLDTVVVSGLMPGPGMWTVRKGEHSMRILGSLQPVARGLEWESFHVEKTVAAAEVVLLPPKLHVDTGMGKLRQLMLVPALLGARKSNDGHSLEEMVGADDYATWLVFKEKYLGRARGVEKRRPIFAADALYQAAMKKSGMRHKSLVMPVIRKAAKKHDVELRQPVIRLVIDKPREAIREFRAAEIDDAVCFHNALKYMESDLETARIRANAWARGDMRTLHEVDYEDRSRACMKAILQSQFARNHDVSDLPERFRSTWLEEAEAVLAEHRNSFAVLSIAELVGDNGILAQLEARGYQVEEP